MGASTFFVRSKGETASAAFDEAVKEARYTCGKGGYTGTIAEKHGFVSVSVPAGEDPMEYAEKLIDDGDRRVDDKWGPAGCISLGGGKYLFFGWASS